MKALSLKQPFAELIVSGRKTIELRKWNTNFRGKFLVHASKNVDKNAMRRFGFVDSELAVGCIVGKAELVGVKKYMNWEELMKDRKKHLADSDWGLYGFVLKNVERVKKIECNGKLNFWESKYS